MNRGFKAVAVCLALVPLSDCCTLRHCLTPEEARQAKFSRLEQKLVEFSKAVNAYNAQQGGIAGTFSQQALFAALDAIYPSGPNRKAARDLRKDYTVKARPIAGGFYSVVVCDPVTGGKLLEDVSCKTTRVEVRLWDKEGATACDFVPDVAAYCEPL